MTARSTSPLRPIVKRTAPAKINLTLRVGALQPSGYHELTTLFQAIELADRVSVAMVHDAGEDGAPRVELTTRGHDVGPASENLVVRAAHAYLSLLPEGVRAALDEGTALRIELEKNVPPGSGLGGGSSDAASTLLAIDDLLGTERTRDRLMAIAATLGSDVPFFLCGSALALGEGRGEVLTPLAALPSKPVIVALPGVHVSTAEAYGALDRSRTRAAPRAAESGVYDPLPSEGDVTDWRSIARAAVNDFEPVVFGAQPAVARAHEALVATDPLFARMSGSGAAVFAVYEEDAHAKAALERLQGSHDAACSYVLSRTLETAPIR
jgi:4-diphosphocytidyl-2-C-methyl-D-erythritol kinase